MKNKKPTYEELKKKLVEAEELITRIRRGETDIARGERNAAEEQRNIAIDERDTARGQRNTAKSNLDTAIDQRDVARGERDTAKGERNIARGQRDVAMGERDTARDERDTARLDTQELAEAYIASEQNFKNSMDASPMGIRIVTEDGKLIYANKAILDICGYSTAEELAAVPHNRLYTPESYQAYEERKKKRKLKEYVPQEYEISIVRPDGEVRTLQVYRREVIWGGEQQFMAMYQDITEQKRAEEALRDSEERFHSIVEHGNDGIVFIQDKIIQYCNSKMLEIIGYGEAEILGRQFLDFVAPEHKEMLLDIYSLRISGKKVQERYEASLIGKADRKIYVEISASVINLKQAQVDIAIIRDITERKKAEQTLTDEATRRRILVEQSSDGIVVLDKDGNVFEANQRFADMLGYTMDEMKNLHVFDWEFLYPKEQVVEMINTVDEKGDHFETQHKRKDGTTYDVEISTNGAIFAGQKLIFCVCRDITERKQMEKAVRESEERFATAFMSSPEMMVIVNIKEDRYIEVNDSFAKRLGYSRKELIGHTAPEFNLWVYPEEKKKMDRLMEKQGRFRNEEFHFRTKNGDIRTWLCSADTLDIGGVHCMLGTSTDITERRKTQEALRESEEKFSKAFVSSPAIVSITTLKDGRYVEVNDTFLQTTGNTREEVIGKTSQSMNVWVDPKDRERMFQLINEQGQVNKEEFKFRIKSGEIRTWLLSAEPITFGGEECIIGVSVDITERKKAEDALKDSEERLREAQALGKIGSWEYDVIKQTISWSEETFALYERDPDDGPPSEEEEARYYSSEQVKKLRDYTAKAIETKQTFSYDLEVNLPSGRSVNYHAIMQPIQNEQGKVVKLSGTVQDITERKRMEEELEREREDIKLIIDSSRSLIWYKDKDGKFLRVNKAFAEALNMNQKDFLGKTVFDLYTADIAQRMTDDDQGVITSGKPKLNIIEQYQAAAGMRWVQTDKLPVRDKDGNLVAIIGFAQDITEQKQAEEALKESQAMFFTAFHSSPTMMTISTLKDGKIIAANDVYCRVTGYSRKELIDHSTIELNIYSNPEDRTHLIESLKDKESVSNVNVDIQTKTGEVRTVDMSLAKITLKNEPCMITTAIDITDKKMVEDALKESEEKYRLIINSSTDAILLTSPDGGIFAANPAACDMFGRSEEEICRIGRQGLVDSADPRLEAALKKRQATGEFIGELTFIRSDGTKFPGDMSSKIFHDKDGEARTSMIIRDISERKRTEEALIESEERFRQIFQQGPIGIALSGLDYHFTIMNPQYCKMLGYSEKELRSMTFKDFTFPEDIQIDEPNLQKLINGNLTFYRREKRFLNKAKKIGWESLTATLLRDKSGKPLGFLAMTEDITERKKTEEAIQESEEKFNKAFHASLNLMAIVTLDEGRIIDVNEAYCTSTGYKREELIGHTALELNLWADPKQRKVFYQTIAADGRLENTEVSLRTKKGEIRVFLFSAEKIVLYGTPSVVLVALDITERKKAAQRIEYLNQTLRSIRNINQLITREKDRDKLLKGVCDILVESRSFYTAWIGLFDESHKLDMHTVSGPDYSFAPLVESFKTENLPKCVQKALKKSQVITTEDPQSECVGCPVLTDSISHGSMTVRLEYAGNIYGIICAYLPKEILSDENEVSLFQEVAMDISFSLYNIERQTEFERMEQETLRADKLESIGTLAGGIAHDFNNLLTGIVGNIGLVKTNIPSTDDAYEMLDEAEKAALRARDLTQQLLTFAKGGKPVKRPVNIAQIISESATFALRGSKTKLELSLPENLWPIEADEGQISQVINNMVINADEAMPTGGTIKIKAENLALKKATTLFIPSGNYIHINIIDTGIGISPEHLSRIFEPYFTTKQKGSGLGLPTAYSIVRNHGGTIIADSVQNKGSTFDIYLPATRKTMKGGKQLKTESSSQAGGKVLIMDDEEIIRKMLKNMLSLAGYIVELSADGAEALKKYQQAQKEGDPFNAVIMDLTIPGGMGGKETIKKLLEIDPDATAIVSSGYATDPIMSEYKKYGFKAVIAKPYSVKQLQETLSGLLTKRKG